MLLQLKASDSFVSLVSRAKKVSALVLCEGHRDAEVFKQVAPTHREAAARRVEAQTQHVYAMARMPRGVQRTWHGGEEARDEAMMGCVYLDS